MKEFETFYIEKIIDIMKNNELTEVVLEDEDKSLLIKSSGYTPVIKNKKQEVETTKVVEAPVEETVAEVEQVEEKKNLIPIVSNMIGLYYAKPSPEDKPFVQVGDEIKEGQTVCIIETIKLMNKVNSEVSGRVAQLCIEDGKPVEYGQVIMYIEKV